MSDIDLLIAMQGDQQVKGQMASIHQSAMRMRAGFAQGAQALQSMENGFKEFNDTGSVSVGTISSMASVLPLLANPLTAVGVAIGVVVSQIAAMRREARAFRDEQFDSTLARINKQASDQVNIAKAMAGAHGREREILRRLAMEQNLAAELAQNFNDQTKAFLVLAKQKNLTQEEVNRGLEREATNYVNATAASEGRTAQLNEELKALKAANKERNEMVIEHKLTSGERTMQGLTADIAAFMEMVDNAELSAEIGFASIAVSAMQQIGTIGAGAFDTFADSMDRALDAGRFDGESMGRAVRNIVAQSIRAVGQEAAVRSVMELAFGIGALAVGNAPSAKLHFASSAQFAAAATLAGAAAAAVSVSAGGGGGGGGLAGSSPRGGDREQIVNQTVVVLGTLDTRGAEDLAEQLQRARESRRLN